MPDKALAINFYEETARERDRLQQALTEALKANEVLVDDHAERVERLERTLTEALRERDEARASWRCFHCDEVFTSEKCACEHFGFDDMRDPGCVEKVKSGEHGLLRRVRILEQELSAYYAQAQTETGAVESYVHGLQADHARALRREEERGYNKGVQDAWAEYEAKLAEQAREIERLEAHKSGWEGMLRPAGEARKAAEAALVSLQEQNKGLREALEAAHAGIINRVAEVAAAVGWQASVGAMETAGQIVSCLYANPEHIARFMAEGTELFIDGTFDPKNGALTYVAINGELASPRILRVNKGEQH